MTFANYKNDISHYIIEESCRKIFINLFDALGNISSFNDYYAFIRKYPYFNSFRHSKISKYIRSELKENQYYLLILDEKSKTFILPTEEDYSEYELNNLVKYYHKIVNKIIKRSENISNHTEETLEIKALSGNVEEEVAVSGNMEEEIAVSGNMQKLEEPESGNVEEDVAVSGNVEELEETSSGNVGVNKEPESILNNPEIKSINVPIEVDENYMRTSSVVMELFQKHSKENEEQKEEQPAKTYVNPIWKLFGW
jgi:hypothetical protein